MDSQWKIGEWKERKELSFYTVNIKDQRNGLGSKQQSTQWTRLKTTKLLATANQLIRENSVCCFFTQFFSPSERTNRFDTLLLFIFVCFLRTPLIPPPPLFHNERTFWMPAKTIKLPAFGFSSWAISHCRLETSLKYTVCKAFRKCGRILLNKPTTLFCSISPDTMGSQYLEKFIAAYKVTIWVIYQ